MTEHRIACADLLTAEGWREDVTVVTGADGIIEAIEPGREAADLRLAGPVIPGMPNLHSHAFQRAFAGRTGRAAAADSFWTWREAMYRVAGSIGPDEFEATARRLYRQMLRAGYTAVAEFHYLHHDPAGRPYADPAEMSGRIVTAARAAGIGLTLLPVLYQRGGFDDRALEGPQRRFGCDTDTYLDLLERCRERTRGRPLERVGLAPHSLRAVGASALTTVLATRGEAPVHIHVAEQPAEVAEALAALGVRPLAWLLDHAPVDQRWCLVHATHLEDEELRRAAASGAVAGLCPTTEADLGDGFFAAEAWQAAAGAWGIGSDSNLRLDPAEEARLLEFGVRLRGGRRNVLAKPGEHVGAALWQGLARGGGRALGQPVGVIAPGYRADLVELDPVNPLLADVPAEQALDVFVFAGGPGLVRTVTVGGEVRVAGGLVTGGSDDG